MVEEFRIYFRSLRTSCMVYVMTLSEKKSNQNYSWTFSFRNWVDIVWTLTKTGGSGRKRLWVADRAQTYQNSVWDMVSLRCLFAIQLVLSR